MTTYAVSEGGVTTTPTFIVNGSAGTGTINISSQGVVPVAPALTELLIFSDSANRLSWMDSSGFVSSFNTSGNTASRTYTFPNVTDTLVTNTSSATMTNKTLLASGGNTVEATTISGFTITGPFSNGDVMKYDTGTSTWRALSLSASTPMSYSNGNYSIAVGTVSGTVAAGNDARFSTPELVRVKKSNAGAGEFTSINAAIASFTATVTTPYMVLVEPGIYTETAIIIPPYVQVRGRGSSTIVMPATNSIALVTLSSNSCLRDIILNGLGGSTSVGVRTDSITDSLVMEVVVQNFNTCYQVRASTGLNDTYFHECQCRGTFAIGFHSDGRVITSSFSANSSVTTMRIDGTSSTAQGVRLEGPFTFAAINGVRVTNVSTGDAVLVTDGADVELANSKITFANIGLHITNVGAGPNIKVRDMMILNSVTYDVQNDHSSARGIFNGIADITKVVTNSTSDISFSYNDYVNEGTIITGEFYYNPIISGTMTETGSSLVYPAPLGAYNGGAVTAGSGLNANVAAGSGYLANGVYPIQYLQKVSWSATSVALTASSDNYIHVGLDNVVNVDLTTPSSYTTTLLARVRTNATGIEFIDTQYQNIYHPQTNHITMMKNVFGPLYSTGSSVSANGSRQLAISSGLYYYLDNEYCPSGSASPTTWTAYYHSSGVWTSASQTVVDNAQYDNLTNLIAIPAGEYTKHAFYIVGQGVTEKYLLVYGQVTYATLQDVTNGPIPTPPNYFNQGVILIATLTVQQGVATVSQITDSRPRPSSASASSASVSVHGNLQGLLADDHPQYVLTNGGRTMTGNLNLGSNNIINVGTVAGIDVTAHGSRHLPNGADPLTTAAPLTNLTASTTNSVGTANSFARSDHSHAIDQTTFSLNSIGGTLSIAKGGTNSSTALNNNRIMVSSGGAIVEAAALTNGQLLVGSTGAAPAAATLTGTANQVVVTNGAGAITLSLPQSIGTASTPTFASETLTATTNQLTLGTTNTATISATAPAASRTYTIADPGANASFVMTEGTQTINGAKTFSSTIVGSVTGSAGTVSGVVAIANGGTNSSAALTNNRLMWSSGGAIVEATALTNGQLFVGNTGSAPTAATLTGTANQVTVTNGAGTITLSLPQNIGTSSTPTFASETLTATTNQLTLGTTNTATISASAPAASRTYTIADPGANANFVMTEGAQTINGTKTFSSTIVGSVSGSAGSVSGVVAIANGGTNSSTVLNNNRIMVSSGGAIVEAAALTNGQLLVGSTGAAPVASTLTGTANQVTVTNGAGTITLSLPQSIGVGSTPTFASETLTATTNQLTLGTTNTATISATAPAASRTYTVDDPGANANFVMTEGTQTINGAKTFSSTIVGSVSGSAGSVSGIVAVANGGTGLTTLTSGNFLVGGGSSVTTTKIVPTGTVVGTSDSQTLSNKTLVDTTTTFANILDSSKKAAVDLSSAATATTTTLTFAQTVNRTLTLPDATDTLVGLATTDTLTNKTILGSTNNVAANSLKTTGAVVNVSSAAPPTTGQILTATSATTATWQNINTGSLSGTVAATNGGTGQSSYVIGDILYADSTTTLAKLPASTSGLVLTTNGAGTAPTWSGVSVNTASGVLPIANGGTNSSTALNNNQLMISSGGAIVEAGALSNGQLFIGRTGLSPLAATLTGTANQVVVSTGVGSITLSLPQSIGTASTPTFASETLTAATNQLVLGTTNTATISATAPAASRTYTVADPGANANFVMTEGAQTINGAKTFSSTIVGSVTGSAGTVSGVVGAANGGTGSSSYTIGDIIYSTGTTTLSKLAIGLPGQVLISNGTAPTWGSISLSNVTTVTGLLPIASGGTNSSTALNNNRVMVSLGGQIRESSALSNGQIIIGSTGGTPTPATITGTANQVTVTNGANSITLSLPQNIATSSTPTFASMSLTNTSNQVTLGTTNTIVLTAPAPAASRVYTFPDAGANANVVLTAGTQTIAGTTNFSNHGYLISAGAAPLVVTGSQSGLLMTITTSVLTPAHVGCVVLIGGRFDVITGWRSAIQVTLATSATVAGGSITVYTGVFQENLNTGTIDTLNVTGVNYGTAFTTPFDTTLGNINNTGTITWSGNTVTGTGNAWNSSTIVGGIIVPLDGVSLPAIITAVVNPTTLTVNVSQTIASPVQFSINYAGNHFTGNAGSVRNMYGTTITDVSNNVMANSLKTTTVGAPVSIVAAAPTAGQALIATSGTAATWQNIAATGLTGVLPIANGGTNSSTALTNNRLMWSSGSAIVEATALTNGQLFVGSTGSAPAAATLTGTANQVTVTNGAGTITLSLPQNIATASAPTFASETLTATTNQLVLGTTNTVTINATAPAASRVYTIADPGASASFVMTEGAQTANGAKTFTSTFTVGGAANGTTGIIVGRTDQTLQATGGKAANRFVGNNNNISSSANIEFYTTGAGTIYPTRQDFNFSPDNLGIMFDSYYDNAAFRSSSTTGNFQLYKNAGTLQINAANNIAAGTTASFLTAQTVANNAAVTIPRLYTFGSSSVLSSVQQTGLIITSAAAVFTSAMIGGLVAWDIGSYSNIITVLSTTQVLVDSSQSTIAGLRATVYYGGTQTSRASLTTSRLNADIATIGNGANVTAITASMNAGILTVTVGTLISAHVGGVVVFSNTLTAIIRAVTSATTAIVDNTAAAASTPTAIIYGGTNVSGNSTAVERLSIVGGAPANQVGTPAKFSIYGTAGSPTFDLLPIQNFYLSTSAHPVMQYFANGVNDLYEMYDMAWNGTNFISANATANYRIRKNTNYSIEAASGFGAGVTVGAMTTALSIAPTGTVTIPTLSTTTLNVNGTLFNEDVTWATVVLTQAGAATISVSISFSRVGKICTIHCRGSSASPGSAAKTTVSPGVVSVITSPAGTVPVSMRPGTSFSVATPIWIYNNNVSGVGTFYIGASGQFGITPGNPNSSFGNTINNGCDPFTATWTVN